MSINYKQLQELVKEAMFTGGGINEPSAPEGIPHRMPAADTAGSEENMGDSKANKLYEMALAAREAAEKLVEALDEPIYDSAYEDAFKASACMRRVLNSLEESGAHPMPDQRVVPPKATMQKYGSFVPPETHGAYFGNSAGLGMVEEGKLPDVERIVVAMKKIPGLDKLLDKIDNPVEFQTFMQVIMTAAGKNVDPTIQKSTLSKMHSAMGQKTPAGGTEEPEETK